MPCRAPASAQRMRATALAGCALLASAAADYADDDPSTNCDWEGLDCVVPVLVDGHGSTELSVAYSPHNGIRQIVNNGMTLFPVQTHHPPAVRWMEPPPTVGEYYSVAIVDIDSPSRDDPKYRGWLHWLVVNIPGERILEEAGLRVNDCFTKFGEELFAYVGPGPPKGTGWHRYAVLLWNQHGHISFDEVEHPRHDHTGTSATARRNFDARKFARDHGMGTDENYPDGLVYFRSQYDHYSRKIFNRDLDKYAAQEKARAERLLQHEAELTANKKLVAHDEA